MAVGQWDIVVVVACVPGCGGQHVCKDGDDEDGSKNGKSTVLALSVGKQWRSMVPKTEEPGTIVADAHFPCSSYDKFLVLLCFCGFH